ncbi:hypothetical protein PsYK624_048070 [Phanerochaete sordida]|uniref:Uncharacterized protein n=1 Tax=Phanerochaete sordida TaxID=48140 RepID=A0A9P3G6F9_9APHY|nr:hypothetical protein PsYK624_048070 [Phanerochaete sordida]
MALWSSVFGFSLFGLATRFGQLGIQKRNLFENMGGHAIAMVTFGFAGYWAHDWEVRSGEMIKEKRAEIAARRGIKVEDL